MLNDCRRSEAECKAWTIDLTELDALERFVQDVESDLSGIDVLVNNAGGAIGSAALSLPLSDLEYTANLNYLSPLRRTLAAPPAMLERELRTSADRLLDGGSNVNAPGRGGLRGCEVSAVGVHGGTRG